MKCSACKGKGTIERLKAFSVADIVIHEKCKNCNGTGEITLTNDEWRRTCSTEEFAKWIYDIRFDFQIPWKNKEIVQWLKEKHE